MTAELIANGYLVHDLATSSIVGIVVVTIIFAVGDTIIVVVMVTKVVTVLSTSRTAAATSTEVDLEKRTGWVPDVRPTCGRR